MLRGEVLAHLVVVAGGADAIWLLHGLLWLHLRLGCRLPLIGRCTVHWVADAGGRRRVRRLGLAARLLGLQWLRLLLLLGLSRERILLRRLLLLGQGGREA